MTEHWKQFSLYPPGCRNQLQPRQVLHSFLPEYMRAMRRNITRWHVLFEPSALIRIQARDYPLALSMARGIANKVGLDFELGDCSFSHNPALRHPTEDYYGEAPVFGDALWRAFADYFQAASELSLEVQKLAPEQQFEQTRRAIHVLLNALGLTYPEEATVCRLYAERAEGLTKRHYRI